MPQVISTTVYTFAELEKMGDHKAIQKAIEWGYEGAADYDWWDSVYEDAQTIGCKISGFDTGRAQSIGFDLVDSALEVANKILEQHGEGCETYKTAKSFLADRTALVAKYSDGGDEVTEGNEYDFDQECDELEEEFCKSLGSDYLKMLCNDLEYLSSEEAIKGTFEANAYTFTKEGKRFG